MINCVCILVNLVLYFNFWGDLLRILVKKLSICKVDVDFVKCREIFEIFFREDEEGNVFMEVVFLFSKMMRVKEYCVDESVFNIFFYFCFLGEFVGKVL